jgi:hypothetical protein
VQDERTWGEELARDFTAMQPVIGVAGQVAADATGMPELGSVAEAVSRLKVTSVPPAQGAEWFVRKVDTVNGEQLFHGIEWQLSQGLLNQLGSRVAGGLLVSFTSVEAGGIQRPDSSQGLLAVRSGQHVLENGDHVRLQVRAHLGFQGVRGVLTRGDHLFTPLGEARLKDAAVVRGGVAFHHPARDQALQYLVGRTG